jgi:hypothetical protein
MVVGRGLLLFGCYVLDWGVDGVLCEYGDLIVDCWG